MTSRRYPFNLKKPQKMKIPNIAILLITLLLLSNCSNRLIDFTIISSKNVDLSRFSDLERGKDRISGKDSKHIVIFIPIGTPNAKQAVDNAIESTPGAVALVDGVLTAHWWYIPYIYGQQSYIVEGTPLIDQKLLKKLNN